MFIAVKRDNLPGDWSAFRDLSFEELAKSENKEDVINCINHFRYQRIYKVVEVK